MPNFKSSNSSSAPAIFNLDKAIEGILIKVPKTMVFDSHFVIERLIIEHSDSYLDYVKMHPNSNTVQIHGKIARRITKSKYAKKQGFESFSSNIHTKGSSCAAWKRV